MLFFLPKTNLQKNQNLHNWLLTSEEFETLFVKFSYPFYIIVCLFLSYTFLLSNWRQETFIALKLVSLFSLSVSNLFFLSLLPLFLPNCILNFSMFSWRCDLKWVYFLLRKLWASKIVLEITSSSSRRVYFSEEKSLKPKMDPWVQEPNVYFLHYDDIPFKIELDRTFVCLFVSYSDCLYLCMFVPFSVCFCLIVYLTLCYVCILSFICHSKKLLLNMFWFKSRYK